MKQINIFEYHDYRVFLSDWLRENGYSYRGFTRKFSGFISICALARLLSKGKGSAPTNSYKISSETLLRLGKALNLSEKDLDFLLILKLSNDSEVLPGKFGSTLQKSVGRLKNGLVKKHLLPEISTSKTGIKPPSLLSQLVAEAHQTCNPVEKRQITGQAIQSLSIYINRNSHRPGIQRSKRLLKNLTTLASSS